jgi:dTDP-4-amino-4,6-dideoxygalactose transaminase
MYVAYVEERDRKMTELQKMGIAARLGGCPNIGREAVFDGTAADCPVADDLGTRTLSLPVYPTMSDNDVEAVLNAVESVCG